MAEEAATLRTRQAENTEEAEALRAQIASLVGRADRAPTVPRRGPCAGRCASATTSCARWPSNWPGWAATRRSPLPGSPGSSWTDDSPHPYVVERHVRRLSRRAAGLPDRGGRPHQPAGRAGGQPADHRLGRHRPRRRHRDGGSRAAAPASAGCWPACASRPSSARPCGPTSSRCPGWGWRRASARCSDTVTCSSLRSRGEGSRASSRDHAGREHHHRGVSGLRADLAGQSGSRWGAAGSARPRTCVDQPSKRDCSWAAAGRGCSPACALSSSRPATSSSWSQ